MSVAPPNRRPSPEVVRARRREIAHRYRRPFSFNALRRREIEQHAIHMGAADTDDLDGWLIAWVWHNPHSAKPLWEVMHCASRLGREITNAQAAAILEEASITRKHLTADNLAKFLHVTYEQRQALRLTTIGSVNIKRRARRELRQRNDRLYQEHKRRARGACPHSESLSQTKPWEALGMSRRTWERHRNKARDANDANSSAAYFLISDDRFASPGQARAPERRCRAEEKKGGYPSSQTATTIAADRYEALPLELRLAALCLPMPENLARAA